MSPWKTLKEINLLINTSTKLGSLFFDTCLHAVASNNTSTIVPTPRFSKHPFEKVIHNLTLRALTLRSYT